MKISLGGITDNKHNKYFRIEGRLAIMNISKFTQKSVEAVQNCEKLAYEYGNQQIDQEHGQQDHEDHQDHILQFTEKFIPPESRDFFEERDLMQQILEPSKRTEESTDKPP